MIKQTLCPLRFRKPASFLAENAAPKILISGGLAPGGVQTHVDLLARHLGKLGAEVTIAATSCEWPEKVVNDLRSAGIRVTIGQLGSGRFSFVGKGLALLTWSAQLSANYDVLYCHGHGRFHGWMRRFLRPGGLAVYHEIVDQPSHSGTPLRFIHRMNALVANSNPVAANLARLAPHLPVRTIPFLVADATDGAMSVRTVPIRPPVGDRQLRVVYLGRLVSHKGIDWLVNAWDEIVRNANLGPARLDIYGRDYLNEPLLSALRAQASGKAITLHGEYLPTAVPDILAGADLVVLPSTYEGLPLVLVEAMLHGVPFVAMAAGGTSDLANPDVEVAPVGDRAKFVAALAQIVGRLRRGEVDSERLYTWANTRYGRSAVGNMWTQALLLPRSFFGLTAS